MGLKFRFDKESYKCIQCNKDYTEELLSKEDSSRLWSCPICNGYIRVYADDGGSLIEVVRKYVDQLQEGDEIYLRNLGHSGLHKVRKVKINSKGKYILSLKGNGPYETFGHVWVNCHYGSRSRAWHQE
ncbi:hypothetical protein ABE244_04055 [Bacillus toyonensis]|uniref:hypothetical protein n=1 Tax=Bacillus toyonensis TaxID=155322 RepID=UPI003D1B90B5